LWDRSQAAAFSKDRTRRMTVPRPIFLVPHVGLTANAEVEPMAGH
jgi:hypothetical protein